VTKYQKRISGPLLDRIDLHIEVPRVEYEEFSDQRMGESSEMMHQRVESAHERQRKRFTVKADNIRPDGVRQEAATCNADIRPADVRNFCQLDDTYQSLMRSAMNQLQLSVRAYHWILKLNSPGEFSRWRARLPIWWAVSERTKTPLQSSRRLWRKRWGTGRGCCKCRGDKCVYSRLVANDGSAVAFAHVIVT
jgi:hypothetical protein